MAATEGKVRIGLILFSVAAALAVAFQNCAVELSGETPGASSACAPTTSDLDAFGPALTNFLQAMGSGMSGKANCGTCHRTDSGNIAAARFPILPGTDDESKTTNWCTAVGTAATRIRNGYLSDAHPGGVYTDSEIQAVIDWVRALE